MTLAALTQFFTKQIAKVVITVLPIVKPTDSTAIKKESK